MMHRLPADVMEILMRDAALEVPVADSELAPLDPPMLAFRERMDLAAREARDAGKILDWTQEFPG